MVEIMLAAAFRSGAAGLILVVLLLIVASFFRANPKALYGMSNVIAPLLLLLAGLIGLITIVGFMMRQGQSMIALAAAVFAGIVALLRRGFAAVGETRAPSSLKNIERMEPSTTPRVARARQAPASPWNDVSRVVTAPVSLLSKGEMAFYDPLRDIVAGRFEIHVKPSLADVVQCRNHPRAREIATMHVDFLLCDIRTLQPVLAIELDDRE